MECTSSPVTHMDMIAAIQQGTACGLNDSVQTIFRQRLMETGEWEEEQHTMAPCLLGNKLQGEDGAEE